jgi:hypothetical protein
MKSEESPNQHPAIPTQLGRNRRKLGEALPRCCASTRIGSPPSDLTSCAQVRFLGNFRKTFRGANGDLTPALAHVTSEARNRNHAQAGICVRIEVEGRGTPRHRRRQGGISMSPAGLTRTTHQP